MEKSLNNYINLSPEEISSIGPQNSFNINIGFCIVLILGILGHIDSGKTSLAKALTKITSTASLDKHP